MQEFCVNTMKSVADIIEIEYTLCVNVKYLGFILSPLIRTEDIMRKRDFTTGRLTIIISIVMAVIFLLEYGFYSHGTATQLQNNAHSQLSYFHSYASNDITFYYSLAGNDSSAFADSSAYINLPVVGYALLNSDGVVLSSTSPFSNGLSLVDQLKQYTFSDLYSADTFASALNAGKAALTRFYCPPLAGDLYAYSSPVAHTDVTLVLFQHANLLDSQIIQTKNLANTFIVSIIIVMVVLSAWLYFVHAYDRMILNQNRQTLITERRRYKIALASNHNYIWEYSYADDLMIWDDTNSAPDILLDISGGRRRESLQNNIVHPDDHKKFVSFCNSIITPEPTIQAELRILTRNNDYEWFRIVGTKIFDDEGFPITMIGQTTNINERKLEYLSLVEQAEQDQLTKLLSHAAFSEKVSERIANMDEPVILAMLLLDIDDFDALNQSFGYAFADAILIDLAGRLKKLCPENALLSRYAADEFVILLDDVPSMEYVTDISQRIMNIFAGFATNTKINHSLSCCVGTALYPVDATTYDTLFEQAETALYNAKSRGHGCICNYDDTLPVIPDSERNRKSIKRNQLVTSLYEQRTGAENTIIANAIDILFDSRDLHLSINMMLSVIGMHYNLDRIFIREYSEDRELSTITHEWNANTKHSYAARGLIRSHKRTLLFRGYEKNDSDIYCCDNITESPDQAQLLNDVFLADTQSLVQCGIRFQHNYIGCINYCTTEKSHTWDTSELETLALLSKLISSYLLHLRSQEKIDYVSQIDPLTNTYNLNAFLGRADEVLSEDSFVNYAAIYSDLNQFKLINDNYGYRAGDRVLIALASILQKAGGDNAVVARITGDKFVALYAYSDPEELTERIKSIIHDIKHIKRGNNDYYKLIPVIGVYPIQPGDSAIIAVDRANIARKNVGDYHLRNYMYYNESMHNVLLEQKGIEDSMEDALKNREFSVFYQPKFDITSGKLIGSEALVRWNRHSEMVPPIRFIPLFEENGFIVPLDYYVLESVCASLRTRLDAGKKVLPVSVNFSRVHLSTDVLPVVVKATLERYNISPGLIEIELTESALASIEDYQLNILNELRSLGHTLTMDDFGSGMSSLNALRKLPFDVLKIDREFLYSNSQSERERIVLSNVVRMASDLNMKVICEGVETEEQETFLKSIGCQFAQGFLYARPLPEEQFVKEYLDAE